jgi:hypothetical protein
MNHPAYVRLPRRKERCPYSGLSRYAILKLITGENAPVTSYVMTGPSGRVSQRLVNLKSLLEHLSKESA